MTNQEEFVKQYPTAEEILSESFLARYRGRQPDWGFNGVGFIVYKRTYARIVDPITRKLLTPTEIEDYKNKGIATDTEEWNETIERCIRGAQRIGACYTIEEAEYLYDSMFNLEAMYSGRALWQLGTPLVDEFKLADSLLNCFAHETEIITSQGIKKIGDLVDQNVEVMTEYGKYVEAPVKSFGKQKLLKITLSKRGSKKEIFATPNHRWFVHRSKGIGGKVEVLTKDLRPGHKLPSTFGQSIKNCNISKFGIAHGIVFGDGSANEYGSYIRLCGNKDSQLKQYFNNSIKYSCSDHNDPIISCLPSFFKQKPDINLEKPYLFGWLAGYFAADGSVKEQGDIRIGSAHLENLHFVRDVCVKLGIGYSPIIHQDRIGIGQTEPSRFYSIALNGSDLIPEFFLVKEHKERFVNHHYENRYDYKVESVEETDRFEEVYCVQVPETHSFVLEGNILTGNCWGNKIASIDDFAFLIYESLMGGGVGNNISKEYTFELPRIKSNVRIVHKNTKDADWIVPDSKEGWLETIREVLEAFLVTGKGFSFSTICVRNQGEPLKTFGGIAPGPKPLIVCVENLCSILSARSGKKLRTSDVADLVNINGQMVKSGGVRRTAIILGGDPDDVHYAKLKRWDLGTIPSWRSNSNNSILCPSYDHINQLFWEGYNGNGEAYGLLNIPLARKFGRLGETEFEGFSLTDNSVIMFNPCFAEGTLITTRNGLFPIEELVGKEVEVWDGNQWILIDNFKPTAFGAKTITIELHDGSSVTVTPYHKFVLEDMRIIEAQNLVVGDKLKLSEVVSHGDIDVKGAYAKGFLLGDGGFDSTRNKADLYVYGNKSVCMERLAGSLSEVPCESCRSDCETEISFKYSESNGRFHTRGLTARKELIPFVSLYKEKLPNEIFRWNLKSKFELIAGIFDADGTVRNSPTNGFGYQISSIHKQMLLDLQTLLKTIGVKSKIGLMRKGGPKDFNDGYGEYESKDCYRLNIAQEDSVKLAKQIRLSRLYSFADRSNKYSLKSKNNTVTSISTNELPTNVYCCNVPSNNLLSIGIGILSGNCAEATLADKECCNLASLPINRIRSLERMIRLAKLLYKTQKAIAGMEYFFADTNKIVHKNMKLGLSVTGICQRLDIYKEWCDETYKALRHFDKEWSKRRGWPQSIRLSVIQPEGTKGLLNGSTPGGHPGFSNYHIRRIRFGAHEPIVEFVKEMGVPLEYEVQLDGSLNRDILVAEFPAKFEEGTQCADDPNFGAIAQLELVKSLQTVWADQAVSVTVYYKPEELNDVKKWLKENYDNCVKSISFLRYENHNFKQAPLEKISKEEYDKRVKSVKSVSEVLASKKITSVQTDFLDVVDCKTGACPIR